MTCSVIYINTDTMFTVTGVYNEQSKSYVNDAVVTLTLLDDAGDEITGMTWPATMSYVASSDGDYERNIVEGIGAVAGTTGTAVVHIVGDGLESNLRLPVEFKEQDETSLPWTSRTELERLFGRANIRTWADMENDDVDADVLERIRWAVEEATADAQDRVSAYVNIETLCPTKPLRMATTRLAGVLLYESRGIKDATEDGSGKNRLLIHRKAADLFFQQVAAGQRKLTGSQATSFPAAIKDTGLSSDGTRRFRLGDT